MHGTKTYWLLFCCFISSIFSIAQNRDSLIRGEYSLIMQLGAGISYFSTRVGVAEDAETKVDRTGIAGTFRLMWQPDHLVSMGVESGYVTLYSYSISNGSTKGNLSISAIPLLVEFSMPVLKHVLLHGGAGSYILTTHLDYAGKVTSRAHSLGWMAAASYMHRMSEKISFAAELKWLNASEQQLGSITLQATLAWKFYHW
jgi:hypothetical protein